LITAASRINTCVGHGRLDVARYHAEDVTLRMAMWSEKAVN
jgi:hypothetical protein